MANSSSAMTTLDETLDLYLVKKAPGLPDNWREIIVKFLPWITLILLIIALPPVLFLLGLGALVSPFMALGGVGYATNFTLPIIVLIVTLALEALAIPGLFKKSKSGWNLLFYSTLINALYNLVSLNIVNAILSTLISLYFLYQIKSYYK